MAAANEGASMACALQDTRPGAAEDATEIKGAVDRSLASVVTLSPAALEATRWRSRGHPASVCRYRTSRPSVGLAIARQ